MKTLVYAWQNMDITVIGFRRRVVQWFLSWLGILECGECGVLFTRMGMSGANADETVFTPYCERCSNVGFVQHQNDQAAAYFGKRDEK